MGTRRISLVAGLLGAVLAGSLATACARGGNAPGEPGGSMPSSSDGSSHSRSMPPGSPVTPLPSSGTSDQSGRAAEMTLTGEVEAGVEGGCLLLRAGDKAYVLVGGDRGVIRAGARVTVRGRPNPDLVTTCMQGVPFEVAEARAA